MLVILFSLQIIDVEVRGEKVVSISRQYSKHEHEEAHAIAFWGVLVASFLSNEQFIVPIIKNGANNTAREEKDVGVEFHKIR